MLVTVLLLIALVSLLLAAFGRKQVGAVWTFPFGMAVLVFTMLLPTLHG